MLKDAKNKDDVKNTNKRKKETKAEDTKKVVKTDTKKKRIKKD